MSEITHDRLQAECFQWFWNAYPQYRRLLFAALNEIKKLPCESRQAHMIRVNQAKAIGLVAGVFDLLFFFRGVLYGFDVKVGRDRFSKEQLDFACKIEAQGGKCFSVSSLEDFKKLISNIVQQKSMA